MKNHLENFTRYHKISNYQTMLLEVSIIITMLMGNFAHAKDKHKEPPRKCSMPLELKEIDRQPLYIVMKKNKFSLAKPILESGKAHLIVEESESLILICLEKNLPKKEFTNKEIFKAKCTKKGWDPSVEKIIQNECERQVTFELKVAGKKICAKNSKLYEIGIDVLLKSKSFLWVMKTSYISNKWSTEWLPLYTVCFNEISKTTIFTKHIINGDFIDARQTGILESVEFKYDFEFNDVKGTIDPESAYIPEAIKRELIKNSSFVAKFNVERKRWVPGVLVPDGDMLFFNWKPACYFYINTVPFWKSMECAKRNLEQKIRIAASILKKELTIYTGVFKDYEINKREVTLAKDREGIKISLHFWKIIYQEDDKTGIAFVINNNPYFEEYLCKPNNKIGKTWQISNDLPLLGRIYSCRVHDLLAVLKPEYEIPQLQINAELQFPAQIIPIEVMESTIFKIDPSPN